MRKEIPKMGEKWKRPHKIVFFVSVGIAGGVSGVIVGFRTTTILSPVLIGLLAGLLSALLGTVTLIGALWLVRES
jgi:hypothetical protein